MQIICTDPRVRISTPHSAHHCSQFPLAFVLAASLLYRLHNYLPLPSPARVVDIVSVSPGRGDLILEGGGEGSLWRGDSVIIPLSFSSVLIPLLSLLIATHSPSHRSGQIFCQKTRFKKNFSFNHFCFLGFKRFRIKSTLSHIRFILQFFFYFFIFL